MFNKFSKIGSIWRNEIAREVLLKNIPGIADNPNTLFLQKMMTVPMYAELNKRSLAWSENHLSNIIDSLSKIEDNFIHDTEILPDSEYAKKVENVNVEITAPAVANKWDIFEITISGPTHGNPFKDVQLEAVFELNGYIKKVYGFYDGDGIYKLRFMPDQEGSWTFHTISSIDKMHNISGNFICTPSDPNNHGPVIVNDVFHFKYSDGTSYFPIGTTCYAWIHQGNELEDQTLASLAQSPFNKLRMCVFPKSYLYNTNEPLLYPYEGSLQEGWDFTRFNSLFFQHLEHRIEALGRLGIEVDLILFHPYDRWGFAEMSPSQDDFYLRYVISRLAAYRHVWWSLANEHDFMWAKEDEDWDRFGGIVKEMDPYNHLLSNHNGVKFYDFDKSWVTHCSIQRIDVYKTSEATNEWRERWKKPIVIDECAYEGNIDQGWGNISGEEMVRRFWEGTIRGGYVGHGETYMDADDNIWWAKGGKLIGSSPSRISFLREIIESGPQNGLNPLPSEWDLPCAGVEDEYYLFYFGFNQPTFREFLMKPNVNFQVDIIDTWNMTIEKLPITYEGTFRIILPGRPYIAVRMTCIK